MWHFRGPSVSYLACWSRSCCHLLFSNLFVAKLSSQEHFSFSWRNVTWLQISKRCRVICFHLWVVCKTRWFLGFWSLIFGLRPWQLLLLSCISHWQSRRCVNGIYTVLSDFKFEALCRLYIFSSLWIAHGFACGFCLLFRWRGLYLLMYSNGWVIFS